MIKFLAFLLFLPLTSIAEEKNLEQCINDAMEQSTSKAYFACLNKFEIESEADCNSHYQTFYNYTEVVASKMCRELTVRLDIEVFMEDRPKDYFDMFNKDIEGDLGLQSFGCRVPKTEEGLDAYNAEVFTYDGTPLVNDPEIVSQEWFILKAIVHVLEDVGFAEVNFGETIWPETDYRFFTNVYKVDGNRHIGAVDANSNSIYVGGTDKGFKGRGWVINSETNTLSIFMDNLEIGFYSECKWSDLTVNQLRQTD